MKIHPWYSAWILLTPNPTKVVPNLETSPSHWQIPDNYVNSWEVLEELGLPSHHPRQSFLHSQAHPDIGQTLLNISAWCWLSPFWFSWVYPSVPIFYDHCCSEIDFSKPTTLPMESLFHGYLRRCGLVLPLIRSSSSLQPSFSKHQDLWHLL